MLAILIGVQWYLILFSNYPLLAYKILFYTDLENELMAAWREDGGKR